MPESTHITALIANPTGIYGIYSMREVFRGFKLPGPQGSGREYALGAMNALYDRLDSAEAVAPLRRNRRRYPPRQELRIADASHYFPDGARASNGLSIQLQGKRWTGSRQVLIN